MQRWFLSYHSPDQALAERLKAALERKSTGSRVFFAPSSLRAGGFWSKALAEEIAQADAFILLVGEKGIGDWQVLEYDEASGSGTRSGDLWRYTSPYRGLAAMEEMDSDYFFGREREIMDVLSALA